MPIYHTWMEIYNYYTQRGLLSFVINNISNFVIGFVVAFSPIFLFGCCDWKKLNDAYRLTDFIQPLSIGWGNSSLFIKICTIIFVIFVLVHIAQFISQLPTFISLHHYYRDILEIKDNDLYVIDWNEVIEKIAQKDSTRPISLLEIAQEITRFDNYITAFVSDPEILTWKLPYMESPCHVPMSKFFIYLFKIALNGAVLDSNGISLVSGGQEMRIPQTQKILKTRFNLIGAALLTLSPFIFCFEVLYTVFHYFEAIKKCPGTLSYRKWSTNAKWTIREYNELPHIFNQRLSGSYYYANRFIDRFPLTAAQPIFKLISFVCGSLIAMIIIIGLATDISTLIVVKFSGGKTLAWLCTVLAGIYGVCNGFVRDETTIKDPEVLYGKVKDYIHYDFTDESNTARSWKTYRKFSDFFQPLWEYIAIELSSCIINPIIFLFVLSSKAEDIVEFVNKNTVQSRKLGWICKFSSFKEDNLYQSNSQMNKMKRSISNFRLTASFVSQKELIGFNDDILQEEDPFVTRVPSPSFNNEEFNTK